MQIAKQKRSRWNSIFLIKKEDPVRRLAERSQDAVRSPFPLCALSHGFLYIVSEAMLMSCFVRVHWNAGIDSLLCCSLKKKRFQKKRPKILLRVLTLSCGLLSGLLKGNTKHGQGERLCVRPPPSPDSESVSVRLLVGPLIRHPPSQPRFLSHSPPRPESRI